MKNNKFSFFSVAIGSLMAALCSEAQCMDSPVNEPDKNHHVAIVPTGSVISFAGEVHPHGGSLTQNLLDNNVLNGIFIFDSMNQEKNNTFNHNTIMRSTEELQNPCFPEAASTTSSIYSFINEEENQFDLDDISFEIPIELPTLGGAFNSLITSITPSLSSSGEESKLNKNFKSVANSVLKMGTKETIKIFPGGPLAARLYSTYSRTENDCPKGEGSIARTFGQEVKNIIADLPYGDHIIEAAHTLKAPGAETLAETIALCVVPATSIKTEGTIPEILGSMAKSAVITYIPGGSHITTVTGMVGKAVFGTDTLIEGIIQTSWNSICWFDNYKNMQEDYLENEEENN